GIYAVGGIKCLNMTTYLREPIVAAVGGSWLAKRPVIQAHDWQRITEQAREAISKVRALREEYAGGH
ncbi:MAG: hypothetical protein P8Y60_15525, partial [Calditrichota bacterium]